LADTDDIAPMAERRRERYTDYEGFWRVAVDAVETHRRRLAGLIEAGNVVAVTARDDNGRLLGYLFAVVSATPAVYDPDRYTAIGDDFAVDDDLRATTGLELLHAAQRRLAERGVTRVVVVTAHEDEPNA
jgi:hypothetical protein